MRGFCGFAVALWVFGLGPAPPLGAQPVTNPSASTRILTLEEAIELALVNNLNLQSTFDVVQGAQIGENLAESRFNFKVTPSFARGFGEQSLVDQTLGLEVSKLLPFGTTVTGSMRNDWAGSELGNFNNSALSFGVTQPLLRGFGQRTTEYDLENAKRNLQSSERNLELSRQRLAVDVVASYYNIVRQSGLVDVAEKSLERNRELLRASEARLEVGLASKLDVFRAELQLSQAEDAVIFRKEALELALDAFKFNLGLAPSETVALDMVEPEYDPAEVDVEALTALALRSRIEMHEETDRIDDAERSLAVSRQNLLPQLDLNLRYERRGLGETFASSFDFIDNAFNLFLSTSYPLDRSSENASYAMSQIDVAARRRQLRLVEYNIANEVRAAARNLERTGKSILLQERNIDFADKQLRLATLRYQRGLASNFDIIDAENNLIQARSNYVSLVSDYHVARIELKRVTGTLDVVSEFAPGNFLPSARHHP
ncbi:MAG: TolC family protein [Vicinamibacteria bacterium]